MRSCSVRLVFPPSAFGRTYWSLPLLLFCLRGDGLIARRLSCPLTSNPHPLRYSRHPRPGLPLLCRRLAHATRSLTAGSPDRRAAPLLPLLARPFMCLLRLSPIPHNASVAVAAAAAAAAIPSPLRYSSFVVVRAGACLGAQRTGSVCGCHSTHIRHRTPHTASPPPPQTHRAATPTHA